MGVSKDVIKQCLISKQREVDEAVIVNRPVLTNVWGNAPIRQRWMLHLNCQPKL